METALQDCQEMFGYHIPESELIKCLKKHGNNLELAMGDLLNLSLSHSDSLQTDLQPSSSASGGESFKEIAAVLSENYEGIPLKEIRNLLAQYDGDLDKTVEELNSMKEKLERKQSDLLLEEEKKLSETLGLNCIPKFEGESDSDCQVCYENTCDCQFLPCKHEGCFVCFDEIYNNRGECSFCKVRIASVCSLDPSIPLPPSKYTGKRKAYCDSSPSKSSFNQNVRPNPVRISSSFAIPPPATSVPLIPRTLIPPAAAPAPIFTAAVATAATSSSSSSSVISALSRPDATPISPYRSYTAPKARRCGICRQVGHIRTYCPARPRPAMAE